MHEAVSHGAFSQGVNPRSPGTFTCWKKSTQNHPQNTSDAPDTPMTCEKTNSDRLNQAYLAYLSLTYTCVLM